MKKYTFLSLIFLLSYKTIYSQDLEYFEKASNLVFSPANFLKLINESLTPNKSISKYQKSCFKYPYSQIIYPNQPYRLLIKYSKNIIYIFESQIIIPKKPVMDEQKFNNMLKNCLSEGTWRLNKDQYDYEIPEKRLPKEVKDFVHLIIH